MLGKTARFIANRPMNISVNLFGPQYLDYCVRKQEKDCSLWWEGRVKWNMSILALRVY